jgi:hypothetical protein
MSRHLLRWIGAVALLVLLAGAFAGAAEGDKEGVHRFKVVIESGINMDVQGTKQKIDADTELKYTWKRSGPERTLNLDAVRVKVEKDGKPLMNTFMSRAKVVNTQEGKANEVPFNDAPADLKTLLRDSFDAALCKIEVDKSGKEVKRTMMAGPGAKTLVDNGMIANAQLFHAPFHADQDEWQADNEVSMGNGGYAKGKLTYKKVPGGKGGQAVQVSGILTSDAVKQPGTPLTVKDARYVVSGEQTYDPEQREWVSGKLKMGVSFQMASDDKPIGSAKGTMNVTLHKLRGGE